MKEKKETRGGNPKKHQHTPGGGQASDQSSDQAHPLLIAFFVAAAGLVIAMQFGWLSGLSGNTSLTSAETSTKESSEGPKHARMSLSPFDVEMAHQMMDKNNDGICDSCGMPVDMCISGGQMQCTMGSSGGIGELGTAHIHADWKVFISGKEVDWTPYVELHERQMMGDTSINGTSAFIHLHPEKDQRPGRVPHGSVLHMHAAGVPMWLFFKSLGMELTDQCLSVSMNQKNCNDGKNSLKFFVNGKKTGNPADFVFKDKDKLLLSFGPNNEDVSQQIASVSSYSEEEGKES